MLFPRVLGQEGVSGVLLGMVFEEVLQMFSYYPGAKDRRCKTSQMRRTNRCF
jgi:hypothetical protein